MTVRVGVTGIGGGVGQSILKALELSDLDLEITRVDMQDNAGVYFPSKHPFKTVFFRNLKTEPLVYSKELHDNLDAIIPGSDYDVLKYADIKDGWHKKRIKILTSDGELVYNCCDKLLTYQVLTDLKINTPRTSTGAYFKFPFIIKPRWGSASRGVHLITSKEELEFYRARVENPIFQTLIDGEEYTCSVFCDDTGPVGTFIAKRELKNGTTVYAEVIFDEDINKFLLDIAEKLKPRGPLNVQLRKDKDGRLWVIELNPRCSGTTAIRAHFQFNEPDMMIRTFVLGEKLNPPPVRFGKVFRYWNEVYV